MKIINNKIYKANQSLKKSKDIHATHVDSNNTHYKYLSSLRVIEHKQMYILIKHHTQTKKANGIKYIEIPLDFTTPWNNTPSFLPENK